MRQQRKIALALQAGGSHGAYTWGVLDRLLEDPTLEIIGVTGTSAGALNAVVLADGLLRAARRVRGKGFASFGERSAPYRVSGACFGLSQGKLRRNCVLSKCLPT
jgi:predicted acylesterase/phospholipase RssA